ncbi:MAG: helix-turn-helix domain-containing protein [Acutalibacteraceae bacterium]
MSLFDEIKTGLNEAIEYEKGNLKAKKTVLSIEPVKKFTSSEIKSIRNSTGLTQKLFAKYMGVTVKTVEAWESGRNHPDGAACRLLYLTKKDPLFPVNSGIINI